MDKQRNILHTVLSGIVAPGGTRLIFKGEP